MANMTRGIMHGDFKGDADFETTPPSLSTDINLNKNFIIFSIETKPNA